MATLPNASITEEQYLATERLADFKSEFHDGRMFAMSGGSPNHALLSGAILALLYPQMPPGCRVFSPDLRIKVARAGLCTYADCSVICGELELFSPQEDVVLNPLLIVEVLSPSTEDYDRGKKFELYRTIPSFREYLIVHQDRRYIEHYSRQDDGSWVLRDYSDGSVLVEPLGVRIPLDELYSSAINIGGNPERQEE
jgi:Uma2 family endonuclease